MGAIFKADEIVTPHHPANGNMWIVEIDGQEFEADKETAQEVLEMTIEQGDSYEVHQGPRNKLNVAGLLGLEGLKAHKLNSQDVIRSE